MCLHWYTSLLVLCVIRVQEISSCLFGNDLNQLTSSTTTGFIVNNANPSQCPGKATGWNMCYYSSKTDNSNAAYLAVYRPSGSGTMAQYSLVSGSSSIYSVSPIMFGYSCSQFSIPQSQQFVVQQGDVIAACVQPSGSGRVGIVATASGSLRAQLYTGTPSITCGSPLPSTIQQSKLNSMSITLHVSLDINECAVNNGGCNQTCVDTDVGYNCSCFSGFQLASDMKKCTPIVPSVAVPTTSSSVAIQTTATTISLISASATATVNPSISKEASTNTAAIASSVVITIIVLAIVITVVVILLLLYIRRTSKVTISSGMQRNVFENAVYGDNEAELNAYDVAKAVYEPVKDNEETEEKNYGLSYEVPYKVSTMHSGDFGNEMMPAENIYGNDDEDPYCLPPTEEEELYGVLEQHKTLRIPRHEIETKSALGHGQFGGVHKGKWKSPKGECEVAIKVLDPTKSHNDEDKVKFLQEAAIMAQFKHPNVILLYGIVSEGGPLMLVIELAHNKDLRTHLMTMRPDPGQMILSHVRQSLLTYSQQVALGMQYLSSKSFVHRDLAARNVLVTKACVCKIADFGLSRNLDEENYYFSHGGMVPVKWTAPEAVCYKKYSTASDVWSLGCVLYEIWSLGFKPFETISNAEVVENINAGYRLPPPPGCPLLIYEIMIHCWCPDDHARPSFRDIHMSLFQDQDFVLHVPEEAASTHPQAAVLGAPLEAGENMYIELQKSYL
eukprot:Em0008g496a